MSEQQTQPDTPDQSVEGRLKRIEKLLEEVLEEIQNFTGTGAAVRGLGH